MDRDIQEYISIEKNRIDQTLQEAFSDKSMPGNLSRSMMYSLFAGGKRLRPVLLFASYHTFSEGSDKVLKTAAALEMIHTYSLIHDDLPAMDDDDYRRGALTNHRKFDEATAILAGDALLTYSFELITTDYLITAEEKVYLLQALTKASGAEGMVAGQVLDTEGEKKQLSLKELEKIHELKTGQLISFAITAGAYLADAHEETINHLQHFSHYLGLIFQVQDDILDVIGDPEKLGKPVGSDEEKDKSTYPDLLGIEGAIEHKKKYTLLAEEALEKAGAIDSYLYDLLYFFSERDH